MLSAGGQVAAATDKIRVSVSLKDSAGVVSSVLRGALRALGDVEVVTPSEQADYRWKGVVLTSTTPSGQTAEYALALSVSEPLSVFSLWFALRKAFPKATRSDADSVFSQLTELQTLHVTWAATWGNNVYEQEGRKLVAEFDSKCLEKRRIERRLAKQNLTVAQWRSAYNEQISAKDWIC